MHAAFPDYAWTAVRTVVAGDTVVTEWRTSGTHAGDFPGLPATGCRVDFPGVSVTEIAGGVITCERDYFNMADVLAQIGVLPTRA